MAVSNQGLTSSLNKKVDLASSLGRTLVFLKGKVLSSVVESLEPTQVGSLGLGAQVTILDISAKRLSVLEDVFGHQIQTLMSNPFNIEASVRDADVVIRGCLDPWAKSS